MLPHMCMCPSWPLTGPQGNTPKGPAILFLLHTLQGPDAAGLTTAVALGHLRFVEMLVKHIYDCNVFCCFKKKLQNTHGEMCKGHEAYFRSHGIRASVTVTRFEERRPLPLPRKAPLSPSLPSRDAPPKGSPRSARHRPCLLPNGERRASRGRQHTFVCARGALRPARGRQQPALLSRGLWAFLRLGTTHSSVPC